MNVHTNPLITAAALTRARPLFRVANRAERSLLIQIIHELAEFRLMADLLDYEGEHYQTALDDYLTALTGRYNTLASFGQQLEQAADKKETPDDP